MQVALQLGQKALPACRPNPPVGCVLVHNGEIISKGFTQPPGHHHAEAMAINRAPEGVLPETILFVTLEPCSFQGQTPSCAKQIIEVGIKTVYVALEDPHPQNCGQGFNMLEKAGVKVHQGILADKAKMDLQEYLIHR